MDTKRSCGIILDATASIDRTYEMLGDRIEIVPRAKHIRSYKNVTIHVSRPHHVGRDYLAKHARAEWPMLVKRLRATISDQNGVLVITQKRTKDIIKSGPSLAKQEIGHWGDLDGKNNWNHCDTVVIYGLPYPDDIEATNVFHGCTDIRSEDWFAGKREYGRHADIKTELKNGFIVRNMVQAINRAKCRTIIDDNGNCAPTDVYILLPHGIVGDAVLAAIESQMPDAKIAPWEALPNRVMSSLTRNERALLSELRQSTRGVPVTKTHVIGRLFITGRTFERVTAKLRKPNSALMQELAKIGVEFRCGGGRGREAHFLRH